eukprot:14909763-Alexandrium_andersonii.AAC.1
MPPWHRLAARRAPQSGGAVAEPMLSATAPPGGDCRCWDGHPQRCIVGERAHSPARPAGVPPEVGGAPPPPVDGHDRYT